MIAAAEVGAAPLPNLLQAYEAHWLWFAVWGDTFINNAEWNSADVLKQVSILRPIECYRHDIDMFRSTRAITSSLSMRSRAGGEHRRQPAISCDG